MQPLGILNIGGHPKDAILYAGGTMAKHVARGDRVCTLTPNHGLAHHLQAMEERKRGKQIDSGALIHEREREFIDAANELGVTDARFFRHDDSIVLVEREIIIEIADVIGDFRPDIIITHYPYDGVPAHKAVAQMTLLAVEAASGMRVDSPYPSHKPTQIFYHASHGETSVLEKSLPRTPTTLIDITDVIHKKFRAMNKFKSQFYGESSPLQRKLTEAVDVSVAAINARVPYAEAFIAHHPQVSQTLPISEYALEISRKSEAEKYEYMTQVLLDG